jgi:hypothetical protein
MVVAVIALVVAMSGTSYAVAKLPRNSVGSAQIKRNAVTVKKIASNAVTGAKVKDGSLTAADFAAGTLLQGPVGPRGDTGATGATGPSTSAGAWNVPTPFNMTAGFAAVVSLGAAATSDNDSTGTVVIAQAGNLVATADATFRETTSSAIVEVGCAMQYRSLPSGAWDNMAYGYLSLMGLVQGFNGTVSTTALQPVQAGTYDVRLVCREYAGSNAEFRYATLTVVATGQ